MKKLIKPIVFISIDILIAFPVFSLTSHDVTERLSWELQAPLTVRPSDFAAFPAQTNWEEERGKMKEVCMQWPWQTVDRFPLHPAGPHH